MVDSPFYTENTTSEPGVENLESAEGRPADPYDVINFLLKKADEQGARIVEQDDFIALQHQEMEQLKARLDAVIQERDAHMADYEVLLQNTLAVEQELESFKQRANAKPTIHLPMFTEQKLVKLGYAPADPTDRQAV